MRFARRLLPFLCLVPGLGVGQTASIEIVATSDDTGGQRLVAAIRERIRASGSMAVTSKRDAPRVVVSIVTVDPAPPAGAQTIYSVAYIYDGRVGALSGFHLGNSVGICAPDRVAICADTIVADTESHVDGVRQQGLPVR